MANYSNKKGRIGKAIAAVVCGVLCLSAVAGAGTALYMGARNNGWFDKDDETEQLEEASFSGATISAGESNGIKLTSAVIAAEEYESYGISAASVESAYTITASYNSVAVTPTFNWSISGGDDVGNVTITPSSNTLSCVVTCSSVFGTQIVITCASADNSSVNASCTVDYVRRIESITIGADGYDYDTLFCVNSTFSASQNSVVNYSDYSNIDSVEYIVPYMYFSYKFSTGTVYEDLSNVELVVADLVTGNYNSTPGYDSDTVSVTSSMMDVIDTLYGTLPDTEEAYIEVYYALGVASDYLWGIDIYNLTESETTTLYNNLLSYYNAGTALMAFEFTATGAITGTTYSFEMPILFNPEGLI